MKYWSGARAEAEGRMRYWLILIVVVLVGRATSDAGSEILLYPEDIRGIRLQGSDVYVAAVISTPPVAEGKTSIGFLFGVPIGPGIKPEIIQWPDLCTSHRIVLRFRANDAKTAAVLANFFRETKRKQWI